MPYSDTDVKIKGFDLTRAQVLEINCRECGSRPGERCYTEGGNERQEPHFMRSYDRDKGTDPGPTKTRMQKQVESMMEIGRTYLADVLRRAFDEGIITADQRNQIIALTA